MPDVNPTMPVAIIRRLGDAAGLIGLFAVLGFVLVNLDLGWLPNDDGTLAHEAQRVLAGETPHVDFDVPYTGGLGYLNAGAMRLFGENLLSIRYPFYALLVVWAVVAFAMVRPFAPPLLTSGSVVGAVLASMFLYMTPSPTWYNLFLGTFALAATLQYAKARNHAWLVTAGFLLGLSLLAKTTGAYFGLALGLILVQIHVRPDSKTSERILAKTMLAGSVLSVALLVASAPSVSRFLGLVVPFAMVAWAVGSTILVNGRPPTTVDAQGSLARALAAVTVGVLLPVVGFGSYYAMSGRLSALLDSVFAVPTLFISDLARDLPSPIFIAVPVGLGFLVYRLSQEDGLPEWVVWLGLVLGVGSWYLIDDRSILLVFHAAATWLPSLVGIIYLLTLKRRAVDDAKNLVLLALVAGSAAFQLVRFPFSNQYYTIYAFSLAALATVAISAWAAPRVQRTVVVALVIYGAVFGVSKLSGSLFASDTVGDPAPHVRLETARGGLRIPAVYAYYNELISELSAAVARSEILLAGPDSPEIYFLAGADNRTPAFFDFLSEAKDLDYSFKESYAEIRPGVVALNTDPANSDVAGNIDSLLAQDCETEVAYGPIRLFEDCRP